MSKYGIQKGWTDAIYIGRLNKAQDMFLDDKEDHTNPAINAVLGHIVAKYDGEMEFTAGKKKYVVTVKVEDEAQLSHPSQPKQEGHADNA